MGDANSEEPDESASREGRGPKVLDVPEEVATPVAQLVDEGGARVIEREVVESAERVAEALAAAHERAASIVEEARSEAESIREEARQEGRREGYEELVSAVAQVRERYRTVQDEAERDTLELAFRIARRIVGRELERNPNTIREIVSDALDRVRGKRHIVVHVHPDHRSTLEDSRRELSEQLDGASIYFEDDAEIERGGCVIETESNRVDATLEMQFQQLREAIGGLDD